MRQAFSNSGTLLSPVFFHVRQESALTNRVDLATALLASMKRDITLQ